MKKLIIVCLIIAAILQLNNTALARQINFEITVREKASDNDSLYILIEDRTVQVREDIKTGVFITNFTLDLAATYNDSGLFNCNFSLFTLGPQAQTFFKEFRSHAGAIFFLENVRGKGKTIYRVGISPVSIDTTDQTREACNYDYRKDGVWQFDPSAHFDFYYIPKSLGDARWNLLRDFVEINYKDFKELFQLSFPGKINYFLAPCLLPEVIWDKRMGYAIDPPRSNVFALYTHQHNTVDAVPAYLLRIYRYMGYAPPLLAEGLAGYFEFPHYYASLLKDSNQLSPPAKIIKTVDYYRLPELQGFSAASSFVKFLIDTYGWSKFTQLYQEATDLNLANLFDKYYDISLDSLEKQWNHLLDTVTFKTGIYRYFYEREQFIQRQHGMDQMLVELKKRMDSFEDSTYVLSEEGWNRYMRGDYEAARDIYEQLLKLVPNNSNQLMIFGNLLLIDGQYDSARIIYDRLLRVDSTAKTALYKIGESFYWENRFDSAESYFLRDLNEDPSQLSSASAAVMLGELMLTEGDTSSAKYYYEQALQVMEQVYQYGKTRPSFLLRLGQAHLGLSLCGESSLKTAKSFLEPALYFEVHPTRVIFVSRILRELGRLYDFEGERDKAIEHYQQALSYPLSPGFATQVRQYIITPFTGFGPEQ